MIRARYFLKATKIGELGQALGDRNQELVQAIRQEVAEAKEEALLREMQLDHKHLVVHVDQ